MPPARAPIARAPIARALRALLTPLALSYAALGCAPADTGLIEEPLPEGRVALRVENASQFDYEALYAHMSPSFNRATAHKLNEGPIASQTFTQVAWPSGAYLTALRRLVARGPLVAIRSRAPLTPREGQRTLRLLDEGFVLSEEEP